MLIVLNYILFIITLNIRIVIKALKLIIFTYLLK